MTSSKMQSLQKIVQNIGKIEKFSVLHKRHKTAGIIVIGDEILKGDVKDTNSSFTCAILHNLGVKLKKISIIGDNISELSSEVGFFSKQYDYVITTGGIGPTHDDVTFEGVAAAFKVPLVINEEIQKLCEKYDHVASKNKLSRIPETAQLKFYPELKFPRISVENVFILPGIPEYFQKALAVISKDSFQCDGKFYTKYVYVNVTEEKILNDLNKLVGLYPKVEFGSYPRLFDAEYKVKISIESSDEKETLEAFHKLLEIVPKENVVKYV